MIRAKFRVNSIMRSIGSKRGADGTWVPAEVHTIDMSPVYSDDPNSENGKFWSASPGGTLQLTCVNPAAVAELEIGRSYYVDLTAAPQTD